MGPANSSKTFLIKPLTIIYKAFSNPATGSFAWVGVGESEMIYFNDFRWSEKIISWQDFLKLLEGDTIHVSAPKTHYTQAIALSTDIPIICTAPHRFRSYTRGVLNETETEMMDVRWKTFSLFHQIQEDEVKELAPCCKCFANLVLA